MKWKISLHKDMPELAEGLGVKQLTAGILGARGVTSVSEGRRFLNPSLDDMHSPFLFADMAAVVERLNKAAVEREKVLVHGDFDADGITGTVLLVTVLRAGGVKADYFIPDRFADGYGFGEAGLRAAVEGGYSVIVTVDCGITAAGTVEKARGKGIDVIITDHHQPGADGPPTGVPVINAVLESSGYPDGKISGSAAALKVCQAFIESMGLNIKPESLLKIACIGTIADVVPLTGENRIIAYHGLNGLADPRNYGLEALLEVSSLKGKPVGTGDVGFRIGPRLNAAGRMDSAYTAVELFFAESRPQAGEYARKLDRINYSRQKMQAELIEKAASHLDDPRRKRSIVLWGNNWHRGVLGLAAQRMRDRWYRPAVVIGVEEGVGTGSGRGIPGVNLVEVLDMCADCLETYGGHDYAAGLRIREENLEAFAGRFEETVSARLKEEDLIPELNIDAVIPLSSLNFDLLDELERLKPFGIGNPGPLFAAMDVRADDVRVIKDRHVKFKVEQDGGTFEAMFWNGAARAGDIPSLNDIVFSPKRNDFGGKASLLLDIKDFR